MELRAYTYSIRPPTVRRLCRSILTGTGIVIVLLPGVLVAEKRVVRIDQEFRDRLLQKEVSYIVDRTNARTVADIARAGDREWRPVESSSFGFLKHPVWLRLSLLNESERPAHLVLRNEFAMLDSVVFYEPGPAGGYLRTATGDTLPFASRPLRDRVFSFPLQLEAGEQRTVYFRVYSTSDLVLPLRLFAAGEFQDLRRAENMFLTLAYGLIAGMFLYNLLMYASLRTRVYLHYCLCMICSALVLSLRDGLGYEWIWSDFPWLQTILFECMVGCSLFFGSRLFMYLLDTRTQTPRFHRLLNTVAIAALCLGLSFPVLHLIFAYAGAELNPAGFSDELQRTLVLILPRLAGAAILLLIAGALWRAWARQRQAYFFLIAWFSLLLASGATVLVAEGLLPWEPVIAMMPYFGQATMAVTLSLGLADRINFMKAELSRWNDHLEDKVTERTLELEHALQNLNGLNRNLEESLSEARALKTQQDGDYFLTSRLVTPLIVNENSSANIKSEINVQQYKQFTFRGKSGELGGDFCMTENLRLGNRNFVAFISADAMGKSLQGAGGALVLGASLKSLLIRTRIRGSRSRYPELWLYDTYRDLNDLFLTFNYSMMVTCVIGLVDEATGFMYFVNAEHPRSVLFRDGSARFMENEEQVSKLGDLDQGPFRINTFRLQAGDSIYFGSDGREELRSKEQNATDGGLVVDETLFLSAIQKAGGDPVAVRKHLTENLRFRDDYSLLRIMNTITATEFTRRHPVLVAANRAMTRGNGAEAREMLEAHDWTGSDQEAGALRLLGKFFIQQKDFKSAREKLQRFAELHPWEESSLMEISILSKKIRDWEDAADAGEALFARNPDNLKNVLNLAEIYFRTKRDERSRKMLQRARRLDPTHPSVAQLARLIEV